MKKCPNYLKDFSDQWQMDPHKANLDWFKQARYGLFLHYGLYSQLGKGEWTQFHDKIPLDEYDKLYKSFNPSGFDADFITDLALEGEMSYINLTTMHHEGFALWNSNRESWNSWNAARRDLVAELAEACDKKGLGFFTYFTHVLNWRHPYSLPNDKLFSARPDYSSPEPRYKYKKEEDHQFLLDDFHALMEELMELPYPVAGLWLDIIKAYYETPQYIPVEKTYAMIREKRPEALISFKQGATGTEDFAAPEHTGNSMGDKLRQEGKPEAADRADKAWEANKSKRNEICSTLQDKGWGYNSESTHMSAEKAWGLLAYADSINCNLLLNTGPLPDGSIHPEDVKTIRAVGKRIRSEGWPGPDEAVTPRSWTMVKKDDKVSAAAE